MRPIFLNWILVAISAILGLRSTFGEPDSKNLTGFNFSRSNFGVVFRPPGYQEDSEPQIIYWKSDLIQFLNIVSARFSRMFPIDAQIKASSDNGTIHLQQYLPIIVAETNVRKNNSVERSNGTSSKNKKETIVELILGYEMRYTNGELLTSFKKVKAIADKANGIFKNTVKYLIADVDEVLDDDDDYVTVALEEHLTAVKLRTSKEMHEYKIGALFCIHYCGDAASTRVKNRLEFFLPLLDVIIFAHSVREELVSCGVSVALSCTQREMQKCRDKVHRLHPRLEIVFVSTWGPTKNSWEINNISDMVQYWRKMNDWSVAINTTIIMAEAFQQNEFMGWWEVEKNDLSNFYQFKEQSALVSPQLTSNNLTEICLKRRTFNQSAQSNTTIKIAERKFQLSSVYFTPEVKPIDKELKEEDIYSEEDLIPFIEKISTRFTNILIDPLTQEDLNTRISLSYVPNAVAKVNQNRANSNTQVRRGVETSNHVIRVFMQVSTDADDFSKEAHEMKPTNFDVVKSVADEANLAFNGTVQYLLLTRDSHSHTVDVDTLRILEYASKQQGNFTYKVGLVLSFSDCYLSGLIITDTNLTTKLLKQVSIVFFDWKTYTFRWDYTGERVSSSKLLSRKFSICSRLTKTINPHIQVGFTVYWPDTDARVKRSVTELTRFWNEMNDWASNTNNLIVVMNAFDTTNDMLQFTKLGWWKFVEDRHCYDNTTQYTFVETLFEQDTTQRMGSSIDNHLNNNRTSKGNGTLTYFSFERKYNLSFQEPKDDLGFSHQKFGVYFQPNIYDDTQEYYEEDIEILLRIVQTRFSNVLMDPVNVKPDKRELKLYPEYIMKSAARLNKIKYRLQIFTTFRCEHLDKPRAIVEASTDFVLEMADAANDIFSKTVPYIMLEYLNLNDDLDRWKPAETQTEYFKRKSHHIINRTRTHVYQIGGIISVKYCSQKSFTLVKQYLLPHLQLILLRYHMSLQQIRSGVDSAFSDLVKTFEECKVKIIDVDPNMKVGLTSKWSGGNGTLNESLSLVRFWRKMNDYAVANDTLVFLDQAFDNPADTSVKNGWWKVVKTSKTLLLVHEKYQDVKEAERLNSTADSALSEESRQNSYFMVMVGIVTLSLVVVATVCVVAFITVRKYRRDGERLSDRELVHFYKGARNTRPQNSREEVDVNMTSLITSYAYDTSLELAKQAFRIDESSKLGSGAFGMVCLARICKDGKEFTAAVKRVNPGTCPEESLCSLRSLLSEIKALSFLGAHENIVKLLAVHTGEIRNGDVYIFLEACTLGSLKKYLGTQILGANKRVDGDYLCLEEEEPAELNVNQDQEVSQLLAQWSLQIAQGMQFLASKQVVHADLATRNVLLDTNKVAKICDFGLSRKMYNDESYVKSKREPLPWRWLAPESLRRWEFCEKSDVWAYGVTLWEIYTLGDIPYAGLDWDQSFFSRLERGLKLREPMHEPPGKYGENDMYQEVMLKCWHIEPNNRPTFCEIVSMLIDRFSV